MHDSIIGEVQTSGMVDYQPVRQHKLCFVDGKSKLDDQDLTVPEGGRKEILEVGSSLKVADKELNKTLRSLGESMVENIQVIELLF
uniref:Uncharacterized protein n=1 Tax=Arundo donax TaxID=35708 RepID=A0A0A9D026_ARUDO